MSQTRRGLLALAAALLASLALSRLPLSPGDPFRPTLVVLPLVLAGLGAVGRWAAARGARCLPRAVVRTELALLAALVLLLLRRDALGLAGPSEGVENLLAAGLLLLLGHRVGRLLFALRRALGSRLPTRPPWPFFLLPLVVYLALLPWTATRRTPDGDEPYYLLITHSLAFDLDTDLTNNYAQQDALRFMTRPLQPEWADPVGPGGERYSRHNALLPLVLAPAYRLAGPWGAFSVMALLAAAAAWVALKLAAHFWPARPGEALAAWALLAFTPPYLLYAHQVWVEIPAALLFLLALLAIHSWRDGLRGWIALAVPLALLPLLKLRFLLLALPLLALALWRLPRSRRALLALLLLLAALAAGLLIANQLRFEKPLKDHTWQELARLQASPPLAYLRGALGLLFDCAFGLFAANPLWLIFLPALPLLVMRRHPLAADAAICLPAYLAVVSPRVEWYGAWSPPFRLGLVLLPFLSLSLIPLLARRRRAGARILLAGTAALAGVLTLLWLAVPGWTYSLADGGSSLLSYLAGRWQADVGRLFPSFVRTRAASWIWPAACLAAIPLLWWWRSRLRRPGLAGVTVLLGAAAAVPLAAGRLPTRVVEFEDPWIERAGGELYPQRWIAYRPRYRGGWLLADDARLSVPVVAGGRTLSLTLEVNPLGTRSEAAALEVGTAARVMERWRVASPRGWQRAALELGEWPAGEPLVFRLRSDKTRGGARVVLDRARLEWE